MYYIICFVKFDIFDCLIVPFHLLGLYTISDSVISIIKHSRKSLTFDKTSGWVKKEDNSYDEVEICGFVGLYFLNQLGTVIDRVLIYIETMRLLQLIKTNGRKLDRITKDIITLFQEEGLSITTKTNFIDDLAKEKYFPF